jgi:hypothetical protein
LFFGKIVEVNARSPTTRGVPFGNAGSSGFPASITSYAARSASNPTLAVPW